MKTYEYTSINASMPSGLQQMMAEVQQLGKKGWELVSVCPTSSSQYGIDIVTAFLKKEIEK